jgi:hypothetical protein
MRKRLIAKGNIHKSDYLRALVTDTMPGDIPIVISNDGFYKNCKAGGLSNPHQRDFVEKILRNNSAYTIPYRYNIMRTGGSARRLSLTHPSSQIDVAEFYRDCGQLICYFSRRSQASIRSPRKVGSLFFVRGPISEKNKLKKSGIDTVDIETSVSNPASFFSYKGVDRAYKFFQSSDYMRLEKRFPIMQFADVSKCFNSIYTHTLFWAVADVRTAKDNVKASSFSNRFDKLMQAMNFNETNGICVGSEVSRLFAELLLSEIDRRAIANLNDYNLVFGKDYEFRRYVDDYYIFSEDEAAAKKILASIALSLSDFNLHLADHKTDMIRRPFVTPKSRMIREASIQLAAFFDRFISDGRLESGSYSYPKKIWRSDALIRSLIDSVKASCFDVGSGYDASANYIISALAARVSTLISDYPLGIVQENVTEDDYVGAIFVLLEAIYYFYSVEPSVSSSLRVAQAAIQSFDFFSNNIMDRAPLLGERLVRWTVQFVRSVVGSSVHKENDCISLEAINILVVLGEVGRNDVVAQNALTEFCGAVDNLKYFEIVSFLFCMKDDPGFESLRDRIFDRAVSILKDSDLAIDSHAAHLALDILACPYLNIAKRAALFNALRVKVGLIPAIPDAAALAIDAFEAQPWFVDWRRANVLHMIRKKELSAVY